GTFNVCRAAFAQLKEHRGQILNISATLHYLGTPMQLHVSAAKAGVDALTRNLAVEWGRHGIRVNAIAPRPIEDTEGMKRLAARAGEQRPRRECARRRGVGGGAGERAAAEECSARKVWAHCGHRTRRGFYLFGRGEFYQRDGVGG